MKFTKKILTENLFLSTDSPKFFTKGRKQSVVISEGQLDRLLNVVKEGANIKELDNIINEANALIRHAILTENLQLSLKAYLLTEAYTKDSGEGAKYNKNPEDGATYDLEEQGMYDRNPGVAAAEGLENALKGIHKAYEMIRDSETRRKLANSITKLGNFMTITADAIGSGRDQRTMKSTDSLREPLPYPELETVTVDDEIEEIDKGDYKLTKEVSEEPEVIDVSDADVIELVTGEGVVEESKEEKEILIQEDIKKMKQIIKPIEKN